jgi:hypothetical protein
VGRPYAVACRLCRAQRPGAYRLAGPVLHPGALVGPPLPAHLPRGLPASAHPRRPNLLAQGKRAHATRSAANACARELIRVPSVPCATRVCAAKQLWCVVELFVFEQMLPSGRERASIGTLDSLITLRTLPGCDLAAFEHFDVGSASCFYPADAERLLTCIETACGSTGEFNTRARLLLGRLREQHAAALAPTQAAGRQLAGVSIRIIPLAPAEPPAEAAAPRAAARQWTGGRWCLLGLAVALAVVVYATLFAAYASRLSVPIFADCADCAAELRALSLDSHGYYYADDSGRAYRYSGTRAHVTRALSCSAAAAVCDAEGGRLAVPGSAAEARLLSCILGSDSYGAWIGAAPRAVADGEYSNWAAGAEPPYRTKLCVNLLPWGWVGLPCERHLHYICERG